MAVLDRAAITTLLRAEEDLARSSSTGEPRNSGGASIVVTPRDPYQDYSTFGTLTWYLGIAVLVPLGHGPAMDLIDATLVTLRDLLDAQAGVTITQTDIGRVDPVGGVEYIAAIVNIESS